jgi:protocatechuate 3,4-dioxygenase beta subunit
MRALWNRAPLPLAAVFLAALLMPAVHAGESPAKGRVLAGKVVDEKGRPVAGARIKLEGEEPVATGKNGTFELLKPPTGMHALAVYRPGFAPLLIRRLEIAEKDLRVDLGTLTLRKAAVLEGRVTDPEGKPVAGAKVFATTLAVVMMDRFRGTIQEIPGTAVTDPEGRFRLRELHPRERFTLYMQRAGYVDAALGATRATDDKPLEIVLQPEATISGAVIDEAGEPVPNATVRWLPEPSRGSQDGRGTTGTGQDGSFRLAKLDAGPARLVAAAEGRGAAEIDLTLEAGQDLKDVEIHLRNEGPTLEGQVFDRDGRPLAGASVHATRIMPLPERGSATTGESGHFRLEGLLLGETTVYASHPKSSGSIRRKVLIQPGRNEIDMSFPPGHPASGRVLDEQGSPVAGISVWIDSRDRGFEGCQATTTGDDGSFVTCDLPDGSYGIRAWAEEQSGTPLLPVQVSGKPVMDLELRVQRLGRITGRIRGLGPEQLLWLGIGAVQVKGSDTRAGRIDYNGRYEISSLLPGTWEIWLTDSRPPDTPDGQHGRTVLGTVILESGAAEAQGDFEVTGDGPI